MLCNVTLQLLYICGVIKDFKTLIIIIELQTYNITSVIFKSQWHSLIEITSRFIETYNFENIRRKGTTRPYPICFFIFPTIFKPRKNKELAKNADPRTVRNPSNISGTFCLKAKFAIIPINVMKTIGLVTTPLIVAIAT